MTPISCLPPLFLLLALLLGRGVGLSAPQDSSNSAVREKRGTVTLDFGLLLRNVLLKSAQLSAAKANLTRTTRRPTTTTTAAPSPPPPRRRRPIWHPYFASGYLPFDYDYADPPAPASTPAPAPPPAPAPQPTRRVRPQPRPLAFYYGPRPVGTPPAPPPPPPPPQQLPQPQPPIFDYDYDYDAPAAPSSPPTAPNFPRVVPRPRPRPRPQQQQQQQQPLPQRRPAQLGDRLVYQYAQPTDTFSRPQVLGGGVEALAVAAGEEAGTASGPEDVGDMAAANADINGVGNANAATGSVPGVSTGSDFDQSSPPFLVNYDSESDFYSGPPSLIQQRPQSGSKDANSAPFEEYAFSSLGFDSSKKGLTPPNQQYFLK
ncbi:uncharacterized protein [Drosophila bipectinata]|uniref:uncharacterized protein n=1 Tax=Drosophila bipectinata TaxID=42026 RepID=UPI001C89C6D4|nr:proline-rich receptor-like protein kinase PERK2 [Drosophila bipectinata]